MIRPAIEDSVIRDIGRPYSSRHNGYSFMTLYEADKEKCAYAEKHHSH